MLLKTLLVILFTLVLAVGSVYLFQIHTVEKVEQLTGEWQCKGGICRLDVKSTGSKGKVNVFVIPPSIEMELIRKHIKKIKGLKYS